MLINRDNYENYFLLYVDGELSVAERSEVEAFTAANPDLKPELDLLLETVLLPDDIVFPNKFSLLKKEEFSEELREKLLLKIDGACSETESASLDKLIETDAAAAAEWALLQRTILNPDDRVVFENKAVLFRHEPAKVVYGRFIRYAAAAVLLLGGLYFMLHKSNDHVSADLANNTIPVIKKPVKTQPAEPIIKGSDDIATTGTNITNKETGIAENQTPANRSVNKNETEKRSSTAAEKVLKENNELASVPEKKETNDLPAVNSGIKDPAVQSPTLIAKVATQPDQNIVPLETGYAMAANYDADKSDNKILYMDEDEIKHSKAGGLFRKVKRFVERTARIKTGSSVRIAGFELAPAK